MIACLNFEFSPMISCGRLWFSHTVLINQSGMKGSTDISFVFKTRSFSQCRARHTTYQCHRHRFYDTTIPPPSDSVILTKGCTSYETFMTPERSCDQYVPYIHPLVQTYFWRRVPFSCKTCHFSSPLSRDHLDSSPPSLVIRTIRKSPRNAWETYLLSCTSSEI